MICNSYFRSICLFVAGFGATNSHAATVSIDLSGNDHSGYLSFSSVKGWANEPNQTSDPNEITEYPYYYDEDLGRWIGIAVNPLSAASIYAEESEHVVYNKTITDSDFSFTDIGDISYDDGLLSGTGTEVLSPSQFSVVLDASDFHSYDSPHNTGTGIGNFPFRYTLSSSNSSGNGLTFVDGELTSIDLIADVAVTVAFYGDGGTLNFPLWEEGAGFGGPVAQFVGQLTFAGNQFAFDLDVTQTVNSVLGALADTRLVLNRSGSVDAVAAVPEPGSWILLASGISAVAICLRRKRNG
ncbi:PEP-CTERM sorting domain-containing protein [Blastopirellula marina]|uniref:PEP-CTERM sorting domain-containing protein n=1 Tax=Blastopirellula marina TaxID=124 RepID=UPI00058FD10F|nr:PEP-CTERM sorting domain-containing protein [Blastopirellula marina]